jgi:hypothetical protein
MLDIIGDVHGHADELEALLIKMGYVPEGRGYSHKSRSVLFLGDYIDRGPKIVRTLEIVKSMVDSGNAIALMGNHEYNAIMYNSMNGQGDFLRPQSQKNKDQHKHTLEQFNDDMKLYQSFIKWFKTLPIFFENEQIRAVHAYWNTEIISKVKSLFPKQRFTDDKLIEAGTKGTYIYDLLDKVLKGLEEKMPNNRFFQDKESNRRYEARVKWWLDPGSTAVSDYLFAGNILWGDIGKELAKNALTNSDFYKENKPVFFGHYWLNPGGAEGKIVPIEPTSLTTACLDYSVAKNGALVAYRYNGESELSKKNMVYVTT